MELHVGAGVSDASVDDAPIEAPVLYVAPGVHVVRAKGPQGPFEQRYETKGGSLLSVVVAPPQSATPEPTPPPIPVQGPAPQPTPRVEAPIRVEPARSGWSPLVVVAEGALTLVAVGLTIWSGMQTLSTLHEFESKPSARGLEDGRSQQTRTNVLIGTSIGLGVITGVTALFLVDWRGGVAPAASAGTLGVRATF
jgi:hypothetical protein